MPFYWQIAATGGTQDKLWLGDAFEIPDSADWAVNALAPSVADTVRTAEVVARFDDTIIEGRGISWVATLGTTQLQLTVIGWPQTAPPAARTVGFGVFVKALGDGTAIPAVWVTTTAPLADIAIPTATRNIVQQTYTIPYSAFATPIVAGAMYHIEITRPAQQGGTELAGDWCMRGVQLVALP